MNKINPLQLGRGISAILVVLYHAHVLMSEKYDYQYLGGIFYYGFTGVDFFFVLSGFIIYYVHHKDIGTEAALKRFVVRRFTRIFPLYWLVTLLVVPVYFLIPSFGQGYETQLPSIVQSMLLIPQEHRPIVAVGWTLSHELLFYSLFALSIVMSGKWFKYVFLGWVGMTVLFTFMPEFNLYFDFLFSPYNFEFLAGCLAAYLVIHREPILNNVILYTSGAVVFVLACINFTYPALTPQFLFAIACFLIVYALANTKQVMPKPLVYLGNASYSIYLIHSFILSFVFKVFAKLGVFQTLGNFVGQTLLVGVTVMASCVFYSLIEKGIISKINRTIVDRFETYKKPSTVMEKAS